MNFNTLHLKYVTTLTWNLPHQLYILHVIFTNTNAKIKHILLTLNLNLNLLPPTLSINSNLGP